MGQRLAPVRADFHGFVKPLLAPARLWLSLPSPVAGRCHLAGDGSPAAGIIVFWFSYLPQCTRVSGWSQNHCNRAGGGYKITHVASAIFPPVSQKNRIWKMQAQQMHVATTPLLDFVFFFGVTYEVQCQNCGKHNLSSNRVCLLFPFLLPTLCRRRN